VQACAWRRSTQRRSCWSPPRSRTPRRQRAWLFRLLSRDTVARICSLRRLVARSLRTAHVQSARCAACAASSGPVSCGGLATPLARTCLALQEIVTIVLRMPPSVLRIRVWQYESVSLIGGCHKRLHVCSRPSSPVAAISTGGFCKQAEPL